MTLQIVRQIHLINKQLFEINVLLASAYPQKEKLTQDVGFNYYDYTIYSGIYSKELGFK